MKILDLTLQALPFELMAEELKDLEFREPTDWILSRLVNKEGTPKHYDLVKFSHGYKKDRLWFMTEYRGFFISRCEYVREYPRGLTVKVAIGMVVIKLGKVVDKSLEK